MENVEQHGNIQHKHAGELDEVSGQMGQPENGLHFDKKIRPVRII